MTEWESDPAFILYSAFGCVVGFILLVLLIRWGVEWAIKILARLISGW